MTDQEFNKYYRLYESDIRGVARTIARGHNDLCDDLYQVGLIALWKIDTDNIRKNERALIRQAVRNRMIDFLRKQRAQRQESLDGRLARGQQVTLDDGEVVLIESDPKTTCRREMLDEDDFATIGLQIADQDN